MGSDVPRFLISLLAELWLRNIAKTVRFDRSAVTIADVPMLPVEPTTRIVSVDDLVDTALESC